jgi:hypothetical protein
LRELGPELDTFATVPAAAPWLSRSSYFNFAEADVEGSSLYPAGNYERLTEIRAERDPDGVFRAKHAID